MKVNPANSDFRQQPKFRVGPVWALRTLYRISGAEHEQQYMEDEAVQGGKPKVNIIDKTANSIFLIACDYLRGDDSPYDVHDSLLWDMAVDAAKAVTARTTDPTRCSECSDTASALEDGVCDECWNDAPIPVKIVNTTKE